MLNEKTEKTAVLCPFLERECPQGEDTALFCHQLLSAEDAETLGFDADKWVDCFLALRMFATGKYPVL
ncbi:MAG: hypothetical protein ACE5HO_03705 [bacterium]